MILMVIKSSSWLFKPITAPTRCLPRQGCAASQGALAGSCRAHPPDRHHLERPSHVHTGSLSTEHTLHVLKTAQITRGICQSTAWLCARSSVASACSQAGQGLCWGGKGSPISLQAAPQSCQGKQLLTLVKPNGLRRSALSNQPAKNLSTAKQSRTERSSSGGSDLW